MSNGRFAVHVHIIDNETGEDAFYRAFNTNTAASVVRSLMDAADTVDRAYHSHIAPYRTTSDPCTCGTYEVGSGEEYPRRVCPHHSTGESQGAA